jgi:hypothetical protein
MSLIAAVEDGKRIENQWIGPQRIECVACSFGLNSKEIPTANMLTALTSVHISLATIIYSYLVCSCQYATYLKMPLIKRPLYRLRHSKTAWCGSTFMMARLNGITNDTIILGVIYIDIHRSTRGRHRRSSFRCTEEFLLSR